MKIRFVQTNTFPDHISLNDRLLYPLPTQGGEINSCRVAFCKKAGFHLFYDKSEDRIYIDGYLIEGVGPIKFSELSLYHALRLLTGLTKLKVITRRQATQCRAYINARAEPLRKSASIQTYLESKHYAGLRLTRDDRRLAKRHGLEIFE